jgi:hypothetical protein
MSLTDLNQGIEMIIFESIMTTFEPSFIFRGSLGSSKNWLEHSIKSNRHRQIYHSLSKSAKHIAAKISICM